MADCSFRLCRNQRKEESISTFHICLDFPQVKLAFVYLIFFFEEHQGENQIFAVGEYSFENRMKECRYKVEHI